MLRPEGKGALQVRFPRMQSLVRQGKHEVKVQVGEARLSGGEDRPLDLSGAMDASEPQEVLVEEALGSEGNPVEASRFHGFELGGIDRSRVGLARDLAPIDWRVCFDYDVKQVR